MTIFRVVPAALLLALLAGCSATYEERMAYLRKVAQQGAETHQLLRDQEAPTIDADRCVQAWEGLKNPNEYPTTSSTARTEWIGQIQQFFVDSCVSGKPKPVPADAPAPAPTTPAATTTAPSSTPSTTTAAHTDPAATPVP